MHCSYSDNHEIAKRKIRRTERYQEGIGGATDVSAKRIAPEDYRKDIAVLKNEEWVRRLSSAG